MPTEKTTDGEKPVKRAPGARNIKAMAAAAEKYAKRPVPVSVECKRDPETGGMLVDAPHSEALAHYHQLAATFGTASSAFTQTAITQLEWPSRTRGEEQGQGQEHLNASLALVSAIDPQDELEAALAIQMAGCHALTMEMLGRAKHVSSNEHLKLFGDMAVKLQRTFTAQIEALARMRGKGQQTVRVEHVTVQPGAQAIVGDVHHYAPGVPGVGTRKAIQSYEQHQEGARSAALPSPNAQGNGVPIASDAERPVSAPRRVVARRSSRKSERPQARAADAGSDRNQARIKDDAS